jgi:hypothetical protein
MNTVGQNDGILRGWVDGILAFEKADIKFRTVSTLKIERIWMNVYHGGTSPTPENIDLYFDNVVIAKSYIGPAIAPSQSRLIGPSDESVRAPVLLLTNARNGMHILYRNADAMPQNARLMIYRPCGKKVKELTAAGSQSEGYRFLWDYSDWNGKPVSAGAYVCVFVNADNWMPGEKTIIVAR